MFRMLAGPSSDRIEARANSRVSSCMQNECFRKAVVSFCNTEDPEERQQLKRDKICYS